MKTDNSIFTAVLDDDGLRAATLAQVKRLARRRRVVRVARHAAALGVLAVIVAIFLRPAPEPLAEPAGFRVVRSSPHAAEVRTGQGWFASVRTERTGLMAVGGHPPALRVFGTWDTNPAFDYLDDRELLAAFPGRVMLISPGTPEARLIVY